ncbi:hypothetical protein CTheo_3406 [Ceratobasidium theobromae]|uniref:NmrA-like domain-containing protein n=1 Tax=Ceratobasidium theobromae TaxID=1582974 RepID=A0A5N5QPU3_9AGAM|nr:hypothetical protein CTheo_3406 [Ceratobasidium theobromae]
MSLLTAKPLVVVCGATGAQGSSVVEHLLRDGAYRVRALTRNVTSKKSQALERQGVEVISCDLGCEEQVTAALHGAYAVFGLTNFWEHGEEAEIKQGKNLANAAKVSRVKHFIWSSLPHTNGCLAPRHWESKVAVEKYLNDIGVPTTALFAAFYFENLWMFFPPKKLPDGSLILDWFFPSDVLLPSFAVEDLGAWFMLALKNPTIWIGKQMKLCVQKLTPGDYANALSRALGTQVKTNDVSIAQFEAMKAHIPIDLWLNISKHARYNI